METCHLVHREEPHGLQNSMLMTPEAGLQGSDGVVTARVQRKQASPFSSSRRIHRSPELTRLQTLEGTEHLREQSVGWLELENVLGHHG